MVVSTKSSMIASVLSEFNIGSRLLEVLKVLAQRTTSDKERQDTNV